MEKYLLNVTLVRKKLYQDPINATNVILLLLHYINSPQLVSTFSKSNLSSRFSPMLCRSCKIVKRCLLTVITEKQNTLPEYQEGITILFDPLNNVSTNPATEFD